jgi:hypothetical protein
MQRKDKGDTTWHPGKAAAWRTLVYLAFFYILIGSQQEFLGKVKRLWAIVIINIK